MPIHPSPSERLCAHLTSPREASQDWLSSPDRFRTVADKLPAGWASFLCGRSAPSLVFARLYLVFLADLLLDGGREALESAQPHKDQNRRDHEN